MFKKIQHISLIFFLIATTAGFSVSQHYCGDRLVSVSVNGTPESCCGPEGQCCQNETIYLQLDDDFVIQAISLPGTPIDQYEFVSTIYNIYINDSSLDISRFDKFCDSSPPLELATRLSSHQSYLL